jgi:hypothetical protein
MDTIVLKRQLITDATGKPVGAILPLEEFALVEALLKRNFPDQPAGDEQSVSNGKPGASSIREASFFGMWADHPDLQNRTSSDWLEELRQEQ